MRTLDAAPGHARLGHLVCNEFMRRLSMFHAPKPDLIERLRDAAGQADDIPTVDIEELLVEAARTIETLRAVVLDLCKAEQLHAKPAGMAWEEEEANSATPVTWAKAVTAGET